MNRVVNLLALHGRTVCLLVALAAAQARGAEPNYYYIQVTATRSGKEAAYLERLLSRIGKVYILPVRTGAGETLRRVMIGRFRSVKEAEVYLREHRLRTWFPDLWVNPYYKENDLPEVISKSVAQAGKAEDPSNVHIDLYCEKDRKAGEYVTEIGGDDWVSDGQPLRLNVAWRCDTPDASEWRTYRLSRRDPAYSLSPLMGITNLSADTPAGSGSRVGIAYGFRFEGDHPVGLVGPAYEIELLGRSFIRGSNLFDTSFSFKSRFLAGVTLPIANWMTLSPKAGVAWEKILLDATDDGLPFRGYLLPVFGIKAKSRIIAISSRSEIEAKLSYLYSFSSTTSSTVVEAGSRYGAGVGIRHFSSKEIHSAWFVDFDLSSLGTTDVSQREWSLFLGFSLTYLP